MNNLYAKNTDDLFEYSRPKDRVTINDIYADIYKVSEATARKATNQFNKAEEQDNWIYGR